MKRQNLCDAPKEHWFRWCGTVFMKLHVQSLLKRPKLFLYWKYLSDSTKYSLGTVRVSDSCVIQDVIQTEIHDPESPMNHPWIMLYSDRPDSVVDSTAWFSLVVLYIFNRLSSRCWWRLFHVSYYYLINTIFWCPFIFHPILEKFLEKYAQWCTASSTS